ncbi:hypothetical protein [Bradyrhizobium lablabi]|uniref:hypothetical protein n=1 Tax=Bradyrhizobium lablabi TaxID=722472 RepID=UPI001BA84D2F|nr:hypothetical protein [Bradyrhizobium lablabi]MBR0692938.1 hypothetical protein [Bradyrhizobium lablabi]
MTTIKFVSAGLIAIAMFTTSAVAHENFVTERHVARQDSVGTFLTGRRAYNHVRMPTASVTSSRNEPGGVCDEGDNPMIC